MLFFDDEDTLSFCNDFDFSRDFGFGGTYNFLEVFNSLWITTEIFEIDWAWIEIGFDNDPNAFALLIDAVESCWNLARASFDGIQWSLSLLICAN